MALRLMNGGRRLGRLVWLVPLLAVVEHAGSGGVPFAEACSGAGPGPESGWEDLNVADAHSLTRVPIATDGFVLLSGLFNSGETNAEVSLPWIRVTNDTGDDVPGQARVLSTADDAYAEVLLGWQSSQTLPIGTVLHLSWALADDSTAEGGAGNRPEHFKSIELEVVEEPAPLPTPSATLTRWLEVRHGVGERVDCEVNRGCGPFTIQVPTREERLPGVEVSWKLPDFASMVAWQVRAESSDPRNGLATSFLASTSIGRKRADIVTVGDVAFAEDASDYCVVLIAKDLRTGEEARSQPLCESPGEPERELVDHDLTSCLEPPTSDSLLLWCEDHPRDERCQDATPGDGGGGDGGRSAQNPGQTHQPPNVAEPAPAARATPSGGCQLTPALGSAGLSVATLGVLLSLVARRRRRAQ